jgi:uncharacterized hydrophobic protein (TIGR00271 family)
MIDAPPPSPLTAQGDPTWLNPATIKGAILIALGMLFLLFPTASTPLLRYGFGAALIFFGASDLWSYIAGHDRSARGHRLIAAMIAVGTGLGMILWPTEARRIVEVVLAIYLILQGLNIISRVFLTHGKDGYTGHLTRGIISGGLGVAMFFAGDFILDTFLIAGAVVAVVAGGIMLSYGLGEHTEEEASALNAAGVVAILGSWLDAREIGEERRGKVADSLYFEEPDLTHKLTSYSVMLLLSVAIATLAILQDSTAVVIGAMLIAPLMTPIMGTAAAIVNGWRGRMTSSLVLVGVSVVGAIAVAWIIATWTPALVPIAANGQISSRVSPTLLDMGIALAAGAAGAYATVDDRVSASLPGVAIAVALVPPLGVVGVTLRAGLLDDAFGALLLFSTNFVSIILASVVVFFLTGFSPVRRFIDERHDVIKVLGTVMVGALIIMIPLGLTGAAIINTATDNEDAHQAAEDWLEGWDDLELGPVTIKGATVDVDVSGNGDLPSIEALEETLSESLGEDVTVTVDYFETARFTFSKDEGLISNGSNSTP